MERNAGGIITNVGLRYIGEECYGCSFVSKELYEKMMANAPPPNNNKSVITINIPSLQPLPSSDIMKAIEDQLSKWPKRNASK